MSINDFTWEFHGKREEGDISNPLVSIHIHPLKDDWWKNSHGNSIASMGDLINCFFDLNIEERTSFHVFFKNNEYLSGNFPLAAEVPLSDEQLCHYFYSDSISMVLKNHHHIKGKRIYCDYHLLENCDFVTCRRVTQIRSTLEGGSVVPGQSQLFFVFFENRFNFSDVTQIYWKYRQNYYSLEKRQLPVHVLQNVA